MKGFLLGVILISTNSIADDIVCLTNPDIGYSGNAGLVTTTDFAEKADDYYDMIKEDKDIVKGCSIYEGIRRDIYKIFNKALEYRRDGDIKGVSKRAIRARAARCLKSMHYQMGKIGEAHVNYIGTTMEAGTNQDYNVTTNFSFDQFCDAPQTSNNSPGLGSGLVAVPGGKIDRIPPVRGGTIDRIPPVRGGTIDRIPPVRGGRIDTVPGTGTIRTPGDTTTDKPNIGSNPRVVKKLALECPQRVQVIPPESPNALQAKPTFTFNKIKEIALNGSNKGKFNYVCNYKYAPSRTGINWYMSGKKSKKCAISGNRLYCP